MIVYHQPFINSEDRCSAAHTFPSKKKRFGRRLYDESRSLKIKYHTDNSESSGKNVPINTPRRKRRLRWPEIMTLIRIRLRIPIFRLWFCNQFHRAICWIGLYESSIKYILSFFKIDMDFFDKIWYHLRPANKSQDLSWKKLNFFRQGQISTPNKAEKMQKFRTRRLRKASFATPIRLI